MQAEKAERKLKCGSAPGATWRLGNSQWQCNALSCVESWAEAVKQLSEAGGRQRPMPATLPRWQPFRPGAVQQGTNTLPPSPTQVDMAGRLFLGTWGRVSLQSHPTPSAGRAGSLACLPRPLSLASPSRCTMHFATFPQHEPLGRQLTQLAP